jgi:hypothetical protein
VHKAGVIGGAANLSARIQHVPRLIAEYRRRYIGILDCEHPAESTAFFRVLQLDELYAPHVTQ